MNYCVLIQQRDPNDSPYSGIPRYITTVYGPFKSEKEAHIFAMRKGGDVLRLVAPH